MKSDTRARFAYIETLLYWGDGLTANELGETFGLARQTAQGVISEYQKLHPTSMRFDAVRKRQVAAPGFEPCYIRPDTGEFLDYLRGQEMSAFYMEQQAWSDLPFFDVDHLWRPRLRRQPLRHVFAALHDQRVVTMHYQAKGGARMREFSPHHLIFAGNRYHVRGYCHVSNVYLDFVLSRILSADPSDAEWVSSRDDGAWNDYANLEFIPNEQLPTETRDALAVDFGLAENQSLRVACRKALVLYVERELLRLDFKYRMPLWVRVC